MVTVRGSLRSTVPRGGNGNPPPDAPKCEVFMLLAQAALDAGDPISFAPLYFLRRPEGSPGRTRCWTLNTIGDQNVPLSSGNAFARAAGTLPVHDGAVGDALRGSSLEYATPSERCRARYGRTPDTRARRPRGARRNRLDSTASLFGGHDRLHSSTSTTSTRGGRCSASRRSRRRCASSATPRAPTLPELRWTPCGRPPSRRGRVMRARWRACSMRTSFRRGQHSFGLPSGRSAPVEDRALRSAHHRALLRDAGARPLLPLTPDAAPLRRTWRLRLHPRPPRESVAPHSPLTQTEANHGSGTSLRERPPARGRPRPPR